ncbi:hypothetical protein CL614_00965 [archaeon]|nr:hypothetical protein [archaeon]|tara:strand:+ start:141 stop:797 length:657 start_codon:yes stop_codon:yes gene_type:complete
MGKSVRTVIAVVIFVALLGFGVITIIGQDNIIFIADNFISKITTGMSLPDNVIRNISFELKGINYINTTYDFKEPVNITIDSSNFTIHTITDLHASSATKITGFTGTVMILSKDKNLSITGEYEKIEISDVSISTAGTISESHTTFSSIFLEQVKLKTLEVSNATGTLTLEDIEMNINEQSVKIYAPITDIFYNNYLRADGRANRMTVEGDNVLSISE